MFVLEILNDDLAKEVAIIISFPLFASLICNEPLNLFLINKSYS